jgi:hypothetical protein
MSPPIGTSRMATIMPTLRNKVAGGLNHFRVATELRVVRHLILARRAGVLTLVAAGGVLLVAGPAAAGVTVSPSTAEQTGGADLTFHVTNTEQSAITKIELVMPPDSPIAEVYPLSVPDWAPQTTMQTLAEPLNTIHGGTPVTQTAKDITWLAMPGKSIAPGTSTDLSVSLGPLPTLSKITFTVVPTYADGRTGTPMPPTLLTLTPAAPGAAGTEHAAHDGTTPTGGTASTDPAADLFAQTVAQADQGPGFWSIAGWVIAGLAGIGALVAVWRSRRRDEPAADEPDSATPDEPKEPVSAGARRVSSWRYRDGPEDE